jgi:hypothetical protein
MAYFSFVSTVQYSTVQYSTVQYSIVQYSAVQCVLTFIRLRSTFCTQYIARATMKKIMRYSVYGFLFYILFIFNTVESTVDVILD